MSARRRRSDAQILHALALSRSANHAAQLLGMSCGAMRKRCKSGTLKRELRAAVRRGLKLSGFHLDKFVPPGVYSPITLAQLRADAETYE